LDLLVLAVPGCPNVMLLEERLAQVLEGRDEVSVSRHVIADQEEAARQGMHGSPTILVNGMDPFAEPGQPASVSCRLYRDGDGQVDGASSVSQLRQAIEDAPAPRSPAES
jgi:predicted DsbA family dithiol-disulfide isomerase